MMGGLHGPGTTVCVANRLYIIVKILEIIQV
jgi:hypothetical protein